MNKTRIKENIVNELTTKYFNQRFYSKKENSFLTILFTGNKYTYKYSFYCHELDLIFTSNDKNFDFIKKEIKQFFYNKIDNKSLGSFMLRPLVLQEICNTVDLKDIELISKERGELCIRYTLQYKKYETTLKSTVDNLTEIKKYIVSVFADCIYEKIFIKNNNER